MRLQDMPNKSCCTIESKMCDNCKLLVNLREHIAPTVNVQSGPSSCCANVTDPAQMCKPCRTAWIRNKAQQIVDARPNAQTGEEELKNNVIPREPTCVENDMSYFGQASLPRSAQLEEPPPYEFHERTFADVLESNEPVKEEPKPYLQPSDGRITTNLPEVDKNDILPLPVWDWGNELAPEEH